MSLSNIGFHEFNQFLLQIVNETFPNAELYLVDGGDFVQDVIMKIKQGEKEFQYRPYNLYCEGCLNNSFEEVVERLISDILKK